jgi:hypothetical protein
VREDDGTNLKVHFMGWEEKWDIWVARSSPKLQRHHSKVPNWRIFRANDKFEMRKDGKWYLGKVEKVDVQLGVRDDALAALEVTTGIASGDTVLLGAARGISVGTMITVSAPRDATPAQKNVKN